MSHEKPKDSVSKHDASRIAGYLIDLIGDVAMDQLYDASRRSWNLGDVPEKIYDDLVDWLRKARPID